jgi:diadenosine tetraphosphate (Ap4A) HIT family hydrolase
MKNQNCKYCQAPERIDVALKTAELEITNLYVTFDQSYKGRCILALKTHKTEFFLLDKDEQAAFSRDLAKAAKAIWDAFKPDKLNYMVCGDLYPHFHMHLVPKYEGGKTWGVPFDMALSEKDAPPEAEFAAIAEEIRKRL